MKWNGDVRRSLITDLGYGNPCSVVQRDSKKQSTSLFHMKGSRLTDRTIEYRITYITIILKYRKIKQCKNPFPHP